MPSHLRLWVVTLLGLAVDLWSKEWAFRRLAHDEPWAAIKGFLNLQLSLNPGALFGIGAGFAPIFVGASVLALLFVLYLFANSDASRWSMHVALGLVLGGALGNLYDRATQSAFVAYTPAGRDIGILVEKTETHIVLEDFPRGGNRRVLRQVDRERSGMQPVVRDFIKIDLRIGRLPLWPWIFNIADALLVVGVAMLLFNFWTDRRHPAPATSEAKAAATSSVP
ncbi:MAG TPA: signal peptidase II [Phycisphaerae bacterium]|nr:signal peptidase II [Phycisphaerae bacterium]